MYCNRPDNRYASISSACIGKYDLTETFSFVNKCPNGYNNWLIEYKIQILFNCSWNFRQNENLSDHWPYLIYNYQRVERLVEPLPEDDSRDRSVELEHGAWGAALTNISSIMSSLLFISVSDPWHFDADPYLWLMDPDPTPFFSDFKDAKKNHIFSYNLPAGTLSSVLKI